MIKVAVLGYGTVGSGVVEVFRQNQEVLNKSVGQDIELKYVLDLREFPGDPVEKVLVHDFETIVNDPEVNVVVEVMGGLNPSFNFVKRCLENGKSVCTSNKELVAQHGTDLLQTAREHHVNFLFEASCGGGIPIIRPLYQSLTADKIDEVSGILNGTTNYILSKMASDGSGFEEVLKKAQDKGYAERNPEADVEGYDACRKIAILSSLAFGNYVDYKDIYTEGITRITAADIKYAQTIGVSIKLLAISRRTEKGTYAMVSPVMIDSANSLYSVNGVFNAISIHGNMLGDAMFYGRGAGKLPTASAVVADVVEAAKNLNKTVMGEGWNPEKLELLPLDEVSSRFFVRIRGNASSVLPAVEHAFGEVDPISIPSMDGEFGFITGEMTEAEYREKSVKLEGIISMIRARLHG
ncbi:homoserine dehydrogenase [Novisyntrophococcus fermenticellae]|uniref:homoserine dehydrogenase n=1 Tax=Novisyntrophococcus fermenticellae TaxID=2068655 RepID=UPI001E63A302|nr:homoserine dehydrogenase [Novisyntrophococcus fermenticellae]